MSTVAKKHARGYDSLAPVPRAASTWRAAHQAIKSALVYAALDAACPAGEAASVLDCGCGRGAEWSKLSNRPIRTYSGFDLSAASIAQAAERYPPLSGRGPAFRVADACSDATWAGTREAYDLVVWMFALHYTLTRGPASFRRAVKRTCDACRPGGCVAVAIPHGERIREALASGGVRCDAFELEPGGSDGAARFVVHGHTPGDAEEPVLDSRALLDEFAAHGFTALASGPMDEARLTADLAAKSGVPELTRLYFVAVLQRPKLAARRRSPRLRATNAQAARKATASRRAGKP